ncbi:MAG: hypothetical protein ACWA49_13500, partial [Ruegeria sp.]
MVYSPGGKRYHFEGNGTVAASRTDEAYELVTPGTSNPNSYLFKDGRGQKYTFDTNGTGLLELSKVGWPDGYQITLGYVSGELVSLTDNRDQRAEYAWGDVTYPGATTPFRVIEEIEVDAYYDGTTFDPDIRVELDNGAVTDWRHGALLLSARTVDLNDPSSPNIQEFTYTYATDVLDTDVPRLIGIADGRVDSSGQPYDYATFSYDTSTFDAYLGSFRADVTEHAGGVDKFQISLIPGSGTAGDYKVTNPLGKETDQSYDWIAGAPRPVQINGIATASCLATTQSLDYTPNAIPGGGTAPEGYVYERTLRNGSVTTYERDDRGLVLTKTEDANGSSPRVTTYTWDTAFRLPLTRTNSELEEIFTYDTDGQLTSYTQKDVLSGSPTNGQTRTWTYHYGVNLSGLKLLTSVDGPSTSATDVTSYTYNPDGTLATVTDPNGLVTSYSNYDAFGNATTITEPNGIEWSLTYDARGLITEVIEYSNISSDNKKTFAYDIVGQLISYTNGQNDTWTFTYGEARRLTEVENPKGEKAVYTYDAMGNVTKTEYFDGASALTFSEDAAFDELGRLKTLMDARGTTSFQY